MLPLGRFLMSDTCHDLIVSGFVRIATCHHPISLDAYLAGMCQDGVGNNGWFYMEFCSGSEGRCR